MWHYLFCGACLVLDMEAALVQNAAARLLTEVRPCQHTTPLPVHWLQISYWAEFNVLLLIYIKQLGTSLLVGSSYPIYANLTALICGTFTHTT